MSKVTKTEIIGGTSSAGVKTGISAVDLVYQTYNMVPSILDAPAWSTSRGRFGTEGRKSMINGHWYAFVNTNLSSNSTVNTIDAAKHGKAVMRIYWCK